MDSKKTNNEKEKKWNEAIVKSNTGYVQTTLYNLESAELEIRDLIKKFKDDIDSAINNKIDAELKYRQAKERLNRAMNRLNKS